MHDVIPLLNSEDRQRSLGWLALWWIESFALVGRGGGVGLPERWSMEYARFLANAYALDENGRRRFRHVFLSRPKGCDKSGKAACIALFEALGPCRFNGWAQGGETYTFLGRTYSYEAGEPMGRPVQMPEVICLATSEGQTGNVFESIYYNCTQGPLAQLQGVGLDAGKTRIGLPEGGEIVPSTSGAGSKDGGVETFAVCDETHLYVQPKLRNMYQTVNRNLAKRRLDAEPWLLETTTMYRPGEESVAESTYRYAHAIHEGKVKHFAELYFDHRYASLPVKEWGSERKLRRALVESYGSVAHSTDGKDHVITPEGDVKELDETGHTDDGYAASMCEPASTTAGFVDLDGQMAQMYEPDADPADSMRYFLNTLASSQDSWIDEADIQSHCVDVQEGNQAAAEGKLSTWWQSVIKPSDEITLGFDGSVSDDSTALVGCRVRDGLLFLIKLESAPDGPAKRGWRVDRDGFDGKARWMFEHYNVVSCWADAAYFEAMIQGWESDYPKPAAYGPRGRGMRFYTNSWHQDMFRGLENIATAFRYEHHDVPEGAEPVNGNIGLLADPRLIDHFRNCRRRDRSFGYLVFKETPNSPKKIDAAMAGILAYMARQKYLTAPKSDGDGGFVPLRVY